MLRQISDANFVLASAPVNDNHHRVHHKQHPAHPYPVTPLSYAKRFLQIEWYLNNMQQPTHAHGGDAARTRVGDRGPVADADACVYAIPLRRSAPHVRAGGVLHARACDRAPPSSWTCRWR